MSIPRWIPPTDSGVLRAIYSLKLELMRLTGRKGVLEVRLEGDIGMGIGILPGTSATMDGIIIHSDQHVSVGRNGEKITAAELSRRAHLHPACVSDCAGGDCTGGCRT